MLFFNILSSIKSNGSNLPPQEDMPDVYIIPQYGQSLALNTPSGEPTFESVEPLSYNISLQNSNVQESVGGLAETFREMAETANYSLPVNFKIVGFVEGLGGTPILGLSKGTTPYNNLLSKIQTAKNNCVNAGLSCTVPCFTWTQGEAEMSSNLYGSGDFDPFDYKNRLQQLIIDINTDVKAITGQSQDVLCISYQVGSHNFYGRYPRIAIQQVELAETYNLMTIGKTMYHIDYNTDQVHLPQVAYRNMGNMYGIAVFNATINNIKPKYLKPISHIVNGSQITITFDVPKPPLVLDTTLVTQLADGNYGFNILNVNESSKTISEATTDITSVVLNGVDKVVLNLSRTPVTGEKVTYGVNGVGWHTIDGNRDGKSGRVEGARGCLRDSQDIKNNNTGVIYTDLYNWCVIFEIVV